MIAREISVNKLDLHWSEKLPHRGVMYAISCIPICGSSAKATAAYLIMYLWSSREQTWHLVCRLFASFILVNINFPFSFSLLFTSRPMFVLFWCGAFCHNIPCRMSRRHRICFMSVLLPFSCVLRVLSVLETRGSIHALFYWFIVNLRCLHVSIIESYTLDMRILFPKTNWSFK